MAALHSMMGTIALADIASLYIYHKSFPAGESGVLEDTSLICIEYLPHGRTGVPDNQQPAFPTCPELLFAAC